MFSAVPLSLQEWISMSVREDGSGVVLPLGVAASVEFTLGPPGFHFSSVEEALDGEKRPQDFHSFVQPDWFEIELDET